MSDTDLIVAVQVHALVVNDPVRQQESFQRWALNFDAMLGEDKQAAEPPPGHTDDFGDGVYVQWQLPEALTSGHYDPDTQETTFPLVPNRWLVVRHYTVPGGFPGEGQRRAAAWLVHSDYLELAHGGEHWGTVQFPSPDPDSDTGGLRVDFLGRVHDLREGPWIEPEPVEPFLTAVGPGVLGFAAFQPYQQDVFSFHDDLSDLVGYGHNQPATTALGYLVVGWYSADDIDILSKAADIPGLIPPDAPGLAGVLAGLGWHLPGLTDDPPIPAPQRSVYAGTALGIPWEYYALEAPVSARPGHDGMKVAFGHSTADALEKLAAHQTRSARTGELLSALYSGTIDRLDEGDGDVDADDVTKHAWFSSRAGGYTWLVVPRGTDGPQPARAAPAQPVWLDELNADQAEFEAHALELDHLQERLRTLWWMKDLPNRPAGFTEAAEQQLQEATPGTLAHRAVTAAASMRRILEDKKLPHATTPEELEPQIARYAADRGLPATLELRRAARESYYRTTDPAMVIAGGGVNQPLTRAPDDPLPCRLESTLVESIVINGVPVAAPQPPPLGLIQAVPARASREAARPPVTLNGHSAPLDLGELAGPVAALLREFTLLDLAAITPADDGSGRSALAVALADPSLVTGTIAEYTAVWKQPWLPMYVQWDLRYHAVPYMSDGQANWAFKDDAYEWLGTGADPGDGYTGPTWLPFAGRAFVTPAAPYVVSSQIDRLLQTYAADDAGALRTLRADYGAMDLLSQTLDGFNDHLLMRDTGVRARIPEDTVRLTGDAGHVADPGAPGDDSHSRFQPVRAGQFYFRDLRIIDRFGRCAVITSTPDRFKTFPPLPATSMTPTRKLADDIENSQRFIQLPPRLLHEARVRLELARGQDDTALLAGRAAPAGPDSPLTGWLLINHLDDNLLIYGPDGDPVGELRIIRGTAGEEAVEFTPLPGSPYRREDDPAFEQQHPHLAPFVRELVGPPGRYAALLATIDQTLETIVAPSAEDDRTPARLTGRPVAIYRTRLSLQLRGRPLPNPGWDQALKPDPEEDPNSDQQEYLTYTWPIRLGEPDQLSDGLIGYYASATGPGGQSDYTRLHVAAPATDDPYLVKIGNGEHLALPARPPGQEVIHHLTILADPHVPVHATTDILPVTELRLPGDLAHQALRRIRAAFRLNPLLAPVRVPPPPEQENRSEGQEHLVVVQPAAYHGTWTWAQPHTDPGDGALSWTELPLLAADAAAHPGDAVPHARAGYLLLHPAVTDIPEQP
ncbi:hypothetical protein ACFQVD_00125 [Streptosporangium amethystogenes subsp. fukuiense]|uniref:Uncharacterized protein n=1 Tax=Streptosporangium amethystogenes subsp. fukuiense TaxID=698418 RepID=A0ABW2SR07_9ACTN